MDFTEAAGLKPQPIPLNTPEAAIYLRISASKLSKDRASGRGPRFIRLGAKIFYRRQDIDEYLSTSIVETTDTRRAQNP